MISGRLNEESQKAVGFLPLLNVGPALHNQVAPDLTDHAGGDKGSQRGRLELSHWTVSVDESEVLYSFQDDIS